MISKPVRTKDRKLLDSYHGGRCLICNRTGVVAHHVKTKKSGGPDEQWNLMPLCCLDHNKVHTMGLTSFAEKYLSARNWLLANGWEYDENAKKWRHNEV